MRRVLPTELVARWGVFLRLGSPLLHFAISILPFSIFYARTRRSSPSASSTLKIRVVGLIVVVRSANQTASSRSDQRLSSFTAPTRRLSRDRALTGLTRAGIQRRPEALRLLLHQTWSSGIASPSVARQIPMRKSPSAGRIEPCSFFQHSGGGDNPSSWLLV